MRVLNLLDPTVHHRLLLHDRLHSRVHLGRELLLGLGIQVLLQLIMEVHQAELVSVTVKVLLTRRRIVCLLRGINCRVLRFQLGRRLLQMLRSLLLLLLKVLEYLLGLGLLLVLQLIAIIKYCGRCLLLLLLLELEVLLLLLEE